MTLTTTYACPGGLPFPVQWPDPNATSHTWRWDQVKNPTPLTPLAQHFMNMKRDGMARAAAQMGRPSASERVFANGYVFARPIVSRTEDSERNAAIAERDTVARIDNLLDLWETAYRPEVESLVDALHSWASPDDTVPDLTPRWHEVEAISVRLGELHTWSSGLINVAMRQFEDICKTEFAAAADRIAIETVGGMPNMSLNSAIALWDLSRRAVLLPQVASLLRSCPPNEFAAQLGGADGGTEFLGTLDDFLDEWGLRNESFFEIAYPTWREDPTPVAAILRRYIAAPEDHSPAAMHQRAADIRVARTNWAVANLPTRKRVDAWMAAQRRAQQHTSLMEDHNHYIDQAGHSSLRVPCLAIGMRLAQQGIIERADDVFYLYANEIREAAAHPRISLAATVADRRANREAWMHVRPPDVIGADAQVTARSDPANSTPTPETPVIRGVAASKGVVTGTARLILTLDDAHRLERGDILVTYATAPSWTPLFAVAAAVVTDAGGVLSHCAIVAREYAIPAVVGANGATTRITDGMIITVDGDTGDVHVDR